MGGAGREAVSSPFSHINAPELSQIQQLHAVAVIQSSCMYTSCCFQILVLRQPNLAREAQRGYAL